MAEVLKCLSLSSFVFQYNLQCCMLFLNSITVLYVVFKYHFSVVCIVGYYRV